MIKQLIASTKETAGLKDSFTLGYVKKGLKEFLGDYSLTAKVSPEDNDIVAVTGKVLTKPIAFSVDFSNGNILGAPNAFPVRPDASKYSEGSVVELGSPLNSRNLLKEAKESDNLKMQIQDYVSLMLGLSRFASYVNKAAKEK